MGRSVGLIGRNGAGNTALFRLHCKELDVESGQIEVPDIQRLRPKELQT